MFMRPQSETASGLCVHRVKVIEKTPAYIPLPIPSPKVAKPTLLVIVAEEPQPVGDSLTLSIKVIDDTIIESVGRFGSG